MQEETRRAWGHKLRGQKESGGRSELCRVPAGLSNMKRTDDCDKSNFKGVVEGRSQTTVNYVGEQ